MSQQNKNYYEVLGATPTASIEQIRAAYRDKVRIIHPDSAVVASPTASLQMAEVVRAWSTLSDPILRRAYDEELFDAQSELDESFPPTPIERGNFPKGLIGWILAIGIAGVLVLNVLSDPIDPAKPDGLLQSGSCVVVDTNKLAVEVGCEVDHYGVVRQLIGFDMTCPSDTEAIRDRQGMGQACVVPSQ
jgi:curved DNA-binding protein CbpA